MTLQNILEAVFDLTNKENCAGGPIQNIFFLIEEQRRLHPHIFDFHLTNIVLSNKQCFKVEEFTSLYSTALRKIFPWFYKAPLKPTDINISQIFFITYEILRIAGFRLTPVNYDSLLLKLKVICHRFIVNNFNADCVENYIRRLNSRKIIDKSDNFLRDVFIFSVSFFVILKSL